MCGRFVQHRAPIAYAEHFGLDVATLQLPNCPPRYNAAPTQDLMVVRLNPHTGALDLSLLRWGLVPVWAKDPGGGARLINARSESVAEKPTFRDAWRKKRRCIVPADGFYEWRRRNGAAQPFYITPADGAPMAFAGLWEGWKDPATGQWLRTFTILTCAANETLRPLHDRMPVVLAEADISRFLAADNPRDLLRPAPAAQLTFWPVSPAVNAVRNDAAALIAPVAPPDEDATDPSA
ncbi:SOS response-associated peptidase [Xanthobacter agilis]|uniref:Abasic site processing protein n=1 Tax=Xanthobacter agilis TaxID=47492 RepID=A0ABU0LEE1_XANAG|nr:SOS response-associated peptidase [Xanthobacter agilis]MDQ0505507.1 putative SOS response-associated peptidase YedK [Xanthobacter agilis]